MKNWSNYLITGLVAIAFVYVYNNLIAPRLGTPTA